MKHINIHDAHVELLDFMEKKKNTLEYRAMIRCDTYFHSTTKFSL
jgi:hypothetical protein